MRKAEKTAICRVFHDLIKADTIIDAGEMRCYALMKEKYGISKDEENAAIKITFAEAVRELMNLDDGTRHGLYDDCANMTVSDGFCARSEALLMIALKGCLFDNNEDMGVLSIPKQSFNVPTASVLYVESRENELFDQLIQKNYRMIFKESQIAGFNFIYIPKVIEHYKGTDATLLSEIIQFLSPSLSDEVIGNIIKGLFSMTTRSFCKDVLCNKVGIAELRDTDPALLIKIGHSYVGDEIYANYLKVDVDENMIWEYQHLLDSFTWMLSADTIMVSTAEESNSQFLYHGFYKQLLDIFLRRKNVQSKIVINPYKEEICLPDIDQKLQNLHRKEKALYILFLIMSQEGGLNFNLPKQAKQIPLYNKKLKQLQAQYKLVYRMFGGDNVPDITQAEIRRPIISRIKKSLCALSDSLYNSDDYMILKDSYGNFKIGIDANIVFVQEKDKGHTPLVESEIYKMVIKLQT